MMVHRFLCDVLREMRTAVKVGRIDMLNGLIEEIQTMGNRMEAKLEEYRDLGYQLEKAHEIRKKLREMKKTVGEIEEKLKE